MHQLFEGPFVVPFDFSDESLAALDTALELAPPGAQVLVIHVLPELEANEPGVVWGTVDRTSRTRHAEQALRERLGQDRSGRVQFTIEFGDPGHEIAAFAARQQAGLIVLPSHGRTGLKRLLIGSVAERVVRLASCPVLVLKN
jgi:nucleotide-binding universal stress UspA family protein